MTVVLEPGKIEEIKDEARLEFDEDAVHLWESVTRKVLCTGEIHETYMHSCPLINCKALEEVPDVCPHCGRVVCSFCKLLSLGFNFLC